MNNITIIGDVHGNYVQYSRIIKNLEFSVQVGDFGFNYSVFKDIDTSHVFFGGNHDNYNLTERCKNYLGDYGYHILNEIDFFWVRGAFSIDKKYRTEYIDWWPDEELHTERLELALEEYIKIKPKLMLSHDCPTDIAKIIGNDDILRNFGFEPSTFNTRTQHYLQKMLDVHKPKIWIFGHHHKNVDMVYKNTRFVCLPELTTININKDYLDD